VRRLIDRDNVDILVDCTGHMADNRLPLFAGRCAPVQISWIGYPNTSGLKSMDYRFTDDIVDPVGEPELYTERLVRLANGFCAWMPPTDAPPVSELPAAKNGFVTFGSLHTLARLNEKVIGLWSRVLSAVPGSRLVIFRNTLDDTIIKRLSSWFSGNGIGLNRVVFQRDVPPQGHLVVYQGVDIALDTFPWSGHTTACEALWMGVPVITLRGDRAAGRMVASILSHAGMPELVAETQEQYAELARGMSADTGRLSEIRKGLRNRVQSSTLCDGPACVRGVERELRGLWTAWCGGHR
jgi:predicted O-linked N-acetylglucosamine transferase (SPINDLY family)